ncbi:hypothetical protein, partial [Anaerostipes sp.]|uniref:hypothetical protein n=1 Tax=Anaerostipes sp. TaxID=1872530 RepID=UPI003966A891
IRTAATFKSYHVLSCLSRTFLIYFKIHFSNPFENSVFLSVAHRQLKYNIMLILNCQHFFIFFSFFIFSFIVLSIISFGKGKQKGILPRNP